MSLRYSESIMSEADNLSIRFRTVEQTGILVVTRHDRSQDKLEIVLEGGRVKISISIGSTEKTFFVGQSLNDDIYHTLIFERRALKIKRFLCLMKVQNSTLIALTLQILRRLFFKGAPNLFLQPGLFF